MGAVLIGFVRGDNIKITPFSYVEFKMNKKMIATWTISLRRDVIMPNFPTGKFGNPWLSSDINSPYSREVPSFTTSATVSISLSFISSLTSSH